MLLSRKMSFCVVTHHWYYSLDTRLNYTCERQWLEPSPGMFWFMPI